MESQIGNAVEVALPRWRNPRESGFPKEGEMVILAEYSDISQDIQYDIVQYYEKWCSFEWSVIRAWMPLKEFLAAFPIKKERFRVK